MNKLQLILLMIASVVIIAAALLLMSQPAYAGPPYCSKEFCFVEKDKSWNKDCVILILAIRNLSISKGSLSKRAIFT